MELLQMLKYLYSMLWFNGSLYFIFVILSAIPFRVYRLKCIYNVKEWKIGLIPLAGDMAYNIYNIKIKVLFIISTVCYVLSTGICSWSLLVAGILTGGFAEYIIASEEFHLNNKILYAFCPVYRYYTCYKEVCGIEDKKNSTNTDKNNRSKTNSNIRKDTLVK